jgi:hypothetical protein
MKLVMAIKILRLGGNEMKITYTLLLLTLFLSLGSNSFAQADLSEKAEFYKLKVNNALLVNDQGKYESAFAVLTTKGYENGSKAEFILFEKANNVSIEFQPVLMNGKEFESVGEVTSVRLRSPFVENPKIGFVASETIFSSPPEADAVLITFKRIGSASSEGTKLLAPLEMKPRLTKLRIRIPQAVSLFPTRISNDRNETFFLNASLSETRTICNCPLVELENTTCGYKCRYCANYIDNIINGVICTITCGSNCTNRDCNEMDCGGGDT